MSQTVYKVVRIHQGILVSAFTSGDAMCRYSPDDTTITENGTPLLAFHRRDQAVEFMTDLDAREWPYELWECKAEGARLAESLCGSMCRDVHQKFWAGELDKIFWMSAPAGTVACDSIKLTKLIPWEDA
jgi:hypothetical protein